MVSNLLVESDVQKLDKKSIRLLGFTQQKQTFENGVAVGKAAGLYNGLNAVYNLLDIVVVHPTPMQKMVRRITTFRPNFRQWRKQYKVNTAEDFRQRSELGEKLLAEFAGQYDLIFQLHTLQGPGINLSERPYVITTDNTHAIQQRYWPVPQSKAQTKAWMELESEVYRNAKYLFPWGSHVRESMIEDYGVDPERVIATGTGANFKNKDLKKDNYDRQIALFVGVDFQRKGGEVLLEAWEEVHKRLPNAELWIVGPPSIEFKTVPNVKWYGKINDRDELQAIFEQASLFVLPSLFEPWGHVFLEAMSRGLPCIGTNQFGMVDMIEPEFNGLLVEPKNILQLKEALLNMLSAPMEMQRMGKNAFKRVTDYYNWDAVINRMSPYIEDAIGL